MDPALAHPSRPKALTSRPLDYQGQRDDRRQQFSHPRAVEEQNPRRRIPMVSRGFLFNAALPIQEARSVSRVAWPLDLETVAFTTFGEGAVGSDPDRPSGFQGLMPWRRSNR